MTFAARVRAAQGAHPAASLADVAVLAARKRRTAASAKRHQRPQVPRADEPRAIQGAYAAQLSKIVDALDAETRAALRDEGLRMDAQTGVPLLLPGAPARVAGRLRALVKRLARGKSMVSVLEGVAGKVAEFSREQFALQVRSVLGVDLTSDPPMATAIKAFRRENTDLIVSLGRSHVDRVREVLTEHGSGERVETIMEGIRDATGASKSRATLIARDQVLKLNSDVTQKRHEAAGIVEYTWSTSKDERVRGRPGGLWAKSDEDHWRLEGTRQRYDAPPVVNEKTGARAHPGRSYQCRCTALPIIPGL